MNAWTSVLVAFTDNDRTTGRSWQLVVIGATDVGIVIANIAKLEVSHMTNQKRILGIFWYEFVTNVEVATLSQLPSINEAISRKSHSLFGHVRRMYQVAPAHQALHLCVTSRQGSGQFDTWRRQPSPPRKCWVEQVTTSTGLSLLLMLGVLRRIGPH